MPTVRRPIRGSRAYWPKKRARRIYPRIKKWPKSSDKIALGFVGYKAGMTHVMMIDTNPNSKTKGQMISKSVTLLDCPSLSVFGFRCYDGSLCVGDVLSENLDKNLSRKIKVPKKSKKEEQLKKIEGKNLTQVNLLCHTKPSFKKKPEIVEIAIGGKIDEQLEYAKGMLGKEIKISDVYKEGEVIDVCSVTKGRGFQGPVKRFGIFVQSRNCEFEHRKVGVLGTKEPGKVRSTVPQSGQLGFQTRTELNKRILKIAKPEDVAISGGILKYGKIKNDALLLEGSVPGPAKRLIRIRNPVRARKAHPSDVKTISLSSKQGV
jgi:large subunit ribosomal protein L3